LHNSVVNAGFVHIELAKKPGRPKCTPPGHTKPDFRKKKPGPLLSIEVMVMRQWQVIAKRSGNKFVPVGNYVQLRTRKIPQKRIIIADAQKHKVAGEFTDIVSIKKDLKYLVEPLADVIAVGENCQYVTEGKTVYFNTAAEVFNLEDTIFIREGEIVYEQ
jgi:hypothetical protein